MNKLPTVALHMIVKDEVKSTVNILTAARHSFDEMVVTVSDEAAYKTLADMQLDKVKVDHRPWTNDFAAARNHNMKLSDTDYFFWIDADDEFDFSTIPKLLAYAHENNYDAIYLPYDYAHDEDGNTTALHVRERLIKRSKGFEWRGVVHESLLVDTEFRAKRLDSPAVIHAKKTPEDVAASMERNHQILTEAVRGKTLDDVDPRNLYYYGLSLFGKKQYKLAIEILESYLKVSGWDEEMYRALMKIGECYFMLGEHADAIEDTLRAIALKPEIPDGYFALVRYEYALGNWQQVLDWAEVAFAKPDYETMSIKNPMIREYAKMHVAVAQYSLGNYVKAYKYLQEAPKELSGDLLEGFRMQANLEVFMNLVPELIQFIPGSKLYDAIPDVFKYDKRLKWLRNDVVKPKQWPSKSIVFFCGEGYEEWGAHTLDKGMGGSEEAVVYLSRELAELGYDVTIFNHVNDTFYDLLEDDKWHIKLPPQLDSSHYKEYNGNKHVPKVAYKPWRQFDERDEFDTLVVWRQPAYADGIKARKKIIDLHDILTPEMVTRRDDATYFVKSRYHKTLYPNAPAKNFEVIGNGIKKSQFDIARAKKPNSVGYFSAYYRGLECLIKHIWPRVLKQIPDATLDVYYGWESWVKFKGEDDPFYQRMQILFDKAKDLGVTVHGRVSHTELADAMKRTQVWAYPTEFEEIHCITALKAQEAGCWPVVTDVAALKETVQDGDKIETDAIYSDEYQQQKFADKVVEALKQGKEAKPVPGVDWSDVAKQWDKVIRK